MLEKFAVQPRRLGDLEREYFSTVMWDETNAVKKDHTIRRETRFPDSSSEWVLSGPHFYVGTPFNKTPRRKCTEKGHYDNLDLTQLPDDYLPRTNYVPDLDPAEYRRRTPKVPWSGEPVTEFYRMAHRRMLSQSGERTFVSTIIPKGSANINTTVTTTFRSNQNLVSFVGSCSSLIFDFYTKSTGRADLYGERLGGFPLISWCRGSASASRLGGSAALEPNSFTMGKIPGLV